MHIVNNRGRDFITANQWDQDRIVEILEVMKTHSRVYPNELEFVNKMYDLATRGFFSVTVAQMAWLDRIAFRCGLDPIDNR